MRNITIENVDEINQCVTCQDGSGREGVVLKETTIEHTGKEVEFRYPICETCISEMLKGFHKDK